MKEKKFRLLHILIAVIATANLVVLFLFQYGLSDSTHAVQAAQRASEERAAKSGQSSTEETAAVEEPNGESIPEAESAGSDADGESGTSSDANDAASNGNAPGSNSGSGSAPGSTPVAGTGNGTSGENSSTEETGEGDGNPVITISEPLPTVDSGDLPNLAKVLADLGYIKADDGYGNDITDDITADYEEISSDSMQYRATFTVTNRAGKTVSETCTIATQAGTKPLLELTSDSITLSVGDSFYFMSYIKTARDIDGTSLDTRISISGVVDTSTPGTYELEYYTYSRITSERASKVLTIYVQ